MSSLGQRAGTGAESRPSLTSKLRDALGQALRSKQHGQPRASHGAPGGASSSAAQGTGLEALPVKGLGTYAVPVGDLAAAGGVAPGAAAAAVEGITLSASTLQEVLHDLWGRGAHGHPATASQAPGWGREMAVRPDTGSSDGALESAPWETAALEPGQDGARADPAAAPWTHVQGRNSGLGPGPASESGAAFAPSALHAEWRESLWYPIFGQCPSPGPAPTPLKQQLLPGPPQVQAQPHSPPVLPLLHQTPLQSTDRGAGEGHLDFEVGLEQLDAAFGELQELLDSLQEGPQQSDAPAPGPAQEQQPGLAAQRGDNAEGGDEQGTPCVSGGLDVDWSLGTPLDVQQALEEMRVWDRAPVQHGSTPVAPPTEKGADLEAASSSAGFSGVLLDGERSTDSSHSRGATSAAGGLQVEPSTSQATGDHAGGQRRRRREEDGEGVPGGSVDDPSAGRSTALRTGAAQAGAEAAASRGAAAAARARLRLNELQAGSAGPGGPVALLEAVATAIAKGQEAEAQRLLGVLHEVSSQYGDAAQRVAAYCLQGFQAALPGPSPGAPLASHGPAPGPPSSSTSSASSSTSGSGGSLPSSGKQRSSLLSMGWLDRALRTTRGVKAVLPAPDDYGAVGGVREGEAVAPAAVDCEPHVMKSFQVLMSATPLVSFGHVTANCALLEATVGAPRVHLVDIGTGHGLHLVPLLRAMAARPSGAPTVHLTLVDVASTELHRAYCVIQTSLRLKHAAEQFGLQGASLTMDVVYVKLEELEPQHVVPRPGYTCVVNCTLRLSQHLEGALSATGPASPAGHGLVSDTATNGGAVGADWGGLADGSAALLPPGSDGQGRVVLPSGIAREEQACRAVVRVVKALRPAVCTCVEYRVDASPSSPATPSVSSPHMLSRFLETIHHYVGVFESLDASVARDLSHEQRVLEKDLLGRTIAASVACHGQWHRSRLRNLNHQLPLQEETAGSGEAQQENQRFGPGGSQGPGGGHGAGGAGGAGSRLALRVPAADACHTMLLSERLRRGGLLRRAVSSAEVTTAQQLLRLYRDGFGLRLDEPNSLTLTWKGRALLSSSAWML